MPPAPASAPEPVPDLQAAYAAHLRATGRGNRFYPWAAERFFAAWPEPAQWAAEPLAVRLATDRHTRPLLSFLMLHGHLRPGYDYLVCRKFPSLWREISHSPLRGELERFLAAAAELGFSERVRSGVGSQVVARLLIEAGQPLAELEESDLAALEAALRAREVRSGQGWRHYRGALHASRAVLYHLGVLEQPPEHPLARLRQSFERRLGDVPVPLRVSFARYLERLTGTHARSTVTGTATRLAHFGRHLAAVDPNLPSVAELDRQRHIETYLAAVAQARRPTDGAPVSASERRARVIAVNCFLSDIVEWGWPEAPARRLIFARDIPRLPRPLPRYLPPDQDRRLAEALRSSPHRLAAEALLLQRAAGLRIGELCDLELDCVHELAGQGAWLKVPLGKLDTARMVPLDDEALALIDRIVKLRSPGRPLPHPRHGRPVEFLLTHHGRRLSVYALRDELRRAAEAAGLDRVTPHQLRHTYATALVNAGVSLQSLMALLGHQSAEMSLRYGRLFDQTVRADYERALTLAKERLGPVLPAAPTEAPPENWRELPLLKSRLAGGYCLRTAAQGVCPYTNICEHCPNFRSEPALLAVLAAQRTDAEALAADAERRGWGEEAARQGGLVERLDALIGQADAA